MRTENRDGLAHALQVMTEHFGELRFLLGSVLDGFDRLIGWQVSQGALLRAGTQTAQQQLAELTLISDMIAPAAAVRSRARPYASVVRGRAAPAGRIRLGRASAEQSAYGSNSPAPNPACPRRSATETPSAIIVTPSAHSEQEVRRPHPLLDFCATVSQVIWFMTCRPRGQAFGDGRT